MTNLPRCFDGIRLDGTRVKPEVAARLAPMLSRELARARAEGIRIDPETLATIQSICEDGRGYRQRLAAEAAEEGPTSGTSGSSGTAASGTAVTIGSMEAARQLNVSDRRVRALAKSGALPGRLVKGAWEFDPLDVDERSANGGT